MSTQKDFENFMTSVAESTGISAMIPDDGGLVRVRVEDRYTMNLQFVPANSKIFCFVEIGSLPENAPATIYRELLAAGLFGQETGGGNFSLEALSNTIVYQYLFDFDAPSMIVENFTSALEKILSLVDAWSARLQEVVSSPPTEGSSNDANATVIRA